MMQPVLFINNIPFLHMEIPEVISSMGGTQAVVFHKFPGGYITAQSFGAFPGPLRWSGIFFNFATQDIAGVYSKYNSTQRAFLIDTLRTQGVSCTLKVGSYSLEGYVTSFNYKINYLDQMLTYDIEFTPYLDNSLAAVKNPFPNQSIATNEVKKRLKNLELMTPTPDNPSINGAFSPPLQGSVATSVNGVQANWAEAITQYGTISQMPAAVRAALYSQAKTVALQVEAEISGLMRTNPGAALTYKQTENSLLVIANEVKTTSGPMQAVPAPNGTDFTSMASKYEGSPASLGSLIDNNPIVSPIQVPTLGPVGVGAQNVAIGLEFQNIVDKNPIGLYPPQ